MAMYDAASLFGISPQFLIALLIWGLFWKGLALWNSARNTQKYWFVALLVVNTVGILEIIYLFLFRTDRKKKDVFGRKK